jgi:hypothetical protein
VRSVLKLPCALEVESLLGFFPAKVAVKAAFVFRPVCQLVQGGGVVAYYRRAHGEATPGRSSQMLFDWLVTGHVLDVNPAHAVRGPKYVVKRARRLC